MPEKKTTRTYPSQSALNPDAHLEVLRPPASGKTQTQLTPQITHQQRTALVEKLIDFLKSI